MKINFSLPEHTIAQIDDLTVKCGGLKPSPKSHVLAEAVKRMWEAEMQPQTKPRTRTAKEQR